MKSDMLPEIAKNNIRNIANLISEYDIASALGKCANSRLSALDINKVMKDYGRTFVQIPHEVGKFIKYVEITKSYIPSWAAYLPMWTLEEGRSDLTLELTIRLDGNDVIVELDDFRVL